MERSGWPGSIANSKPADPRPAATGRSSGTVNDIPLVYRYLVDEIAGHAELQPLHQLLISLLPAYLARYPAGQALLGDLL